VLLTNSNQRKYHMSSRLCGGAKGQTPFDAPSSTPWTHQKKKGERLKGRRHSSISSSPPPPSSSTGNKPSSKGKKKKTIRRKDSVKKTEGETTSARGASVFRDTPAEREKGSHVPRVLRKITATFEGKNQSHAAVRAEEKPAPPLKKLNPCARQCPRGPN